MTLTYLKRRDNCKHLDTTIINEYCLHKMSGPFSEHLHSKNPNALKDIMWYCEERSCPFSQKIIMKQKIDNQIKLIKNNKKELENSKYELIFLKDRLIKFPKKIIS